MDFDGAMVSELFKQGMGYVIAFVVYRDYKALQTKMETWLDKNTQANSKLADNLRELTTHVLTKSN